MRTKPTARTADAGLSPIFGRTFVTAMHAPILVIGRDTWDREQCAAIGITHLTAARRVSALAAELKAKSTRDLYDTLDTATLAGSRSYGLCCLFVVWRVFEAKGLDSRAWYSRGRREAIVTFLTIKRAAVLTSKRSRRKSGGRQEFRPTGKSTPLTHEAFQ